jgi:homoserine dehydrogenase
MPETFRIAIAGLGTVGASVVEILQTHKDIITARAGRKIEICGVSARDKKRDRGVDLSSYAWKDNALDLLDLEKLDAVIELIGGEDGLAKTLSETALSRSISLVTANKALLAHAGLDLARIAQDNDAHIMYEAAVAGGIPIIKSLREGFAANKIAAVYGILNGTCNYILSEMCETGCDFDDVLADAQEKGYAEADPAFDVDGIDAAHKLCLLSSLAFGVKPDFGALSVTGISAITAEDIAFADELGFKIKLLGVARNDNGALSQSVSPCLVPFKSTMGAVEGVFNAVFVEGDFVDNGLLVGRGAGGGPTASAVVADIIDLARGNTPPVFGIPVNDLATAQWRDPDEQTSRFYTRMDVMDRPGVLAEIAAVMRDHDISLEIVLQRSRNPNHPVTIVMTTHKITAKQIKQAIGAINQMDFASGTGCYMRIEDF